MTEEPPAESQNKNSGGVKKCCACMACSFGVYRDRSTASKTELETHILWDGLQEVENAEDLQQICDISSSHTANGHDDLLKVPSLLLPDKPPALQRPRRR